MPIVRYNPQKKTKQYNQSLLYSFLEDIRINLQQGNFTQLKEVQRLSGMFVNWTHVEAPHQMIANLLHNEMEYDDLNSNLPLKSRKPYPGLKANKLIADLKQIGNGEIEVKDWIWELEKEGFVTLIRNHPKSKGHDKFCSCSYCRNIELVRIKLSPIWQSLQKLYKMNGREDEVYLTSLCELIAAGILTKLSFFGTKDACGFTSLGCLFALLGIANNNHGTISNADAEIAFASKGKGRVKAIISKDNSKNDDQKIFDKSFTGDLIINQAALNALNRIRQIGLQHFIDLQQGRFNI